MVRDDVRSLRRILELYNPAPLTLLEHPIVGEDFDSLLTKLEVHIPLARLALGAVSEEQNEPFISKFSSKLRVLVSGLLVLCLCALLPDDGLSLTQLVAASGAWACAVWLWDGPKARVISKPSLTALAQVFRVFKAIGAALNGESIATAAIATAILAMGSAMCIYCAFYVEPTIINQKAPTFWFTVCFGITALIIGVRMLEYVIKQAARAIKDSWIKTKG